MPLVGETPEVGRRELVLGVVGLAEMFVDEVGRVLARGAEVDGVRVERALDWCVVAGTVERRRTESAWAAAAGEDKVAAWPLVADWALGATERRISRTSGDFCLIRLTAWSWEMPLHGVPLMDTMQSCGSSFPSAGSVVTLVMSTSRASSLMPMEKP